MRHHFALSNVGENKIDRKPTFPRLASTREQTSLRQPQQSTSKKGEKHTSEFELSSISLGYFRGQKAATAYVRARPLL